MYRWVFQVISRFSRLSFIVSVKLFHRSSVCGTENKAALSINYSKTKNKRDLNKTVNLLVSLNDRFCVVSMSCFVIIFCGYLPRSYHSELKNMFVNHNSPPVVSIDQLIVIARDLNLHVVPISIFCYFLWRSVFSVIVSLSSFTISVPYCCLLFTIWLRWPSVSWPNMHLCRLTN